MWLWLFTISSSWLRCQRRQLRAAGASRAGKGDGSSLALLLRPEQTTPNCPPIKRGGQDMASWGPRARAPWVDTGEGLVVVYL